MYDTHVKYSGSDGKHNQRIYIIKKSIFVKHKVYREAWCHPCRINEGEEFTISWADGGPEVQKSLTDQKLTFDKKNKNQLTYI